MQTFVAGQANTVFYDVVNKLSGEAIVAGTVNFYLIAKDGTNAGKWFKALDSTWSAVEASAGAATYKGGAQWQLSIVAAAWDDGVTYSLYGKESGDLNTMYTDQIFSLSVAMIYSSAAGGTCPVDLTEMKLHLRVTTDTEDTIIAQLMLAATNWCEEFQRRTYITRSRIYYLDEFETQIRPPYSPLVSATVQYIDLDGVTQTIDAANYVVDTYSEPGRITETYGYSWPSTYNVTNAVIVTYDSGYGVAANVSEEIKAAIKMYVQLLYERSEDENYRKAVMETVKNLLWMQRIMDI